MWSREPVAIMTAVVVALVAALACAARFALGRPLEWGELLGLFTLVAGLGGVVTRSQVTPASAPAPKGPTVPPAALGALAALVVLFMPGCASARDSAVASVNAARDFAADAESALETLDRQEQEAAVAHAKTADEARAAVAAVRARYAAAWTSYRRFRAAWLAAAASVRSYDDAERLKRAPDVANLLAFAGSLAEAEAAFAAATAQLYAAPPAQVTP